MSGKERHQKAVMFGLSMDYKKYDLKICLNKQTLWTGINFNAVTGNPRLSKRFNKNVYFVEKILKLSIFPTKIYITYIHLIRSKHVSMVGALNSWSKEPREDLTEKL